MEWENITNDYSDPDEDDESNLKPSRGPQRCSVCHNYKVYDEILGQNRTTPHSCKGKCRGLAYCKVGRFHPSEKKALQKKQQMQHHKKTHAENIRKLKEDDHTFVGLLEKSKTAPNDGPKFNQLVSSLREQLQEKKSDGVAELVEIVSDSRKNSYTKPTRKINLVDDEPTRPSKRDHSDDEFLILKKYKSTPVAAPASGAATVTAPTLAFADSSKSIETEFNILEGRSINLALVNGDGITATPIGTVITNEFGVATMNFSLRLTLDY